MLGIALVLVTLARRLRGASRDPQFRTIALMTAALLAVGTAFYSNIEGWSLLDSLYFCVITLATVGYGDFSPHTTAGKIFTIFYLLLGIGVIVAFADRLVKGAGERGKRWHDMKRARTGRARLLRARANGRQHHRPPPLGSGASGGGERSADV